MIKSELLPALGGTIALDYLYHEFDISYLRTLLAARDISLAMVQIAIFKRLPNLFKNPFLCMPNSISRIVWVERKLSAQI